MGFYLFMKRENEIAQTENTAPGGMTKWTGNRDRRETEMDGRMGTTVDGRACVFFCQTGVPTDMAACAVYFFMKFLEFANQIPF